MRTGTSDLIQVTNVYVLPFIDLSLPFSEPQRYQVSVQNFLRPLENKSYVRARFLALEFLGFGGSTDKLSPAEVLEPS